MAASDLLLKDQNSTPASFAPESTDLATNASGTQIKRPMYGSADGALVTLGAQGDAAATADTGSMTLIAAVKRGLARWTVLLGIMPASLGPKAAGAAFPVTLDSGIETAPGTSGTAALGIQGVTGGLALPTSTADGGNATLGSKADAAPSGPAAAGSVVGLLKGVWSALAGLLAVDTVVKGTATSRSGTVAAGGTAQVLMAANTARRGFAIQNQSSGALYFNSVAAAATDGNSFLLNPGEYFESSAHHVGTGAISIVGATTGQTFYAREF